MEITLGHRYRWHATISFNSTDRLVVDKLLISVSKSNLIMYFVCMWCVVFVLY